MDKSIPVCSGSCQGGRQPCKTPQACEIPESDALEALSWLLYGVIVLVAVAGAAHLIAGYA